jgi:type I restriction enzyme S subunit
MASEWIELPLGDVLTLQRGFDLPSQDRRPGEVPIVSSSGVSGYHSDVGVKGPGVVTGRYGTIGQVFYIKGDYWPLNTTLWVKDFHGNDPLFASYLLRTLDFRSCSDKSSVPGVNRNDLHRISVRIPPLTEQKTIARILGTLDDKIELNRRMNATLEAMARALFQSWFVDFDPVRRKSENRKVRSEKIESHDLSNFSLSTSHFDHLFPDSFQSSELGEIPNGWKIEPLENLAAIRGGKQLPTADCRSTGTFPVFGANGIMGYTEEATHPSFVIAFGRVGAYCGSIHWSLDGAWINNNASAVVPIRANEYVLQAMLGIDFHSMRTGSAQPFIPNSALASAKVVYPGQEISDAFARIIAPLRRLQADNDAQSRTLATLRDTLLPKLLSGDLNVKKLQN